MRSLDTVNLTAPTPRRMHDTQQENVWYQQQQPHNAAPDGVPAGLPSCPAAKAVHACIHVLMHDVAQETGQVQQTTAVTAHPLCTCRLKRLSSWQPHVHTTLFMLTTRQRLTTNLFKRHTAKAPSCGGGGARTCTVARASAVRPCTLALAARSSWIWRLRARRSAIAPSRLDSSPGLSGDSHEASACWNDLHG